VTDFDAMDLIEVTLVYIHR